MEEKKDILIENLNSIECKAQTLWFKLLINTKSEPNTFKIKKNKIIYSFTNLIIFLTYFILLFVLIASIVLRCIIIDKNFKFNFLIGLIVIASISFVIIMICCYAPYVGCMSFTNIAYLIQSKYLVDKFSYFYNIDFSDLIFKRIKKKNNFLNGGCVKYLKEKDMSKLKVIDNIKNSGIISKVYRKDKDKAIKLMQLKINYFYIMTEFSRVYASVIIIIFFLISYIL